MKSFYTILVAAIIGAAALVYDRVTSMHHSTPVKIIVLLMMLVIFASLPRFLSKMRD